MRIYSVNMHTHSRATLTHIDFPHAHTPTLVQSRKTLTLTVVVGRQRVSSGGEAVVEGKQRQNCVTNNCITIISSFPQIVKKKFLLLLWKLQQKHQQQQQHQQKPKSGAEAGVGAEASAVAVTLLAFRSVVYIKQNGRTSFCQRSFWHPDDDDSDDDDDNIRITMQNCCPCRPALFCLASDFALFVHMTLLVGRPQPRLPLPATVLPHPVCAGIVATDRICCWLRWQLYVNCGPFCGFRLLLAIPFWQHCVGVWGVKAREWLRGYSAWPRPTAATVAAAPLAPLTTHHRHRHSHMQHMQLQLPLPLRMCLTLYLSLSLSQSSSLSVVGWQATLQVLQLSLARCLCSSWWFFNCNCFWYFSPSAIARFINAAPTLPPSLPPFATICLRFNKHRRVSRN